MNSFIKVLWFAVFMLLTNVATAGQSAKFVCVDSTYAALVGNQGCQTYELRVSITSGADTGMPGAFGVGVQLDNGKLAYWTIAKGWSAFTSGLVMPVDGYYSSLPAMREYLVFKGSLANLCTLAGGGHFNVYAGHGILTPDKEQDVNTLVSRNEKLSADHIRQVYIQQDAFLSNGKGGVVFSHDCSVTSLGGLGL